MEVPKLERPKINTINNPKIIRVENPLNINSNILSERSYPI